jgi:hypothetical protein
VELSEEIKATRIPVGKYLYADATVFFKVGKNGIREPVRIHIQKLRLNESDPAGSSL